MTKKGRDAAGDGDEAAVSHRERIGLSARRVLSVQRGGEAVERSVAAGARNDIIRNEGLVALSDGLVGGRDRVAGEAEGAVAESARRLHHRRLCVDNREQNTVVWGGEGREGIGGDSGGVRGKGPAGAGRHTSS